MNRVLLYIPIRHNPWAGESRTPNIRGINRAELEKRVHAYDAAWEDIFSFVTQYPVMHQYQDGHPFKPRKLLQEKLDEDDLRSPNIRTIMRLQEKDVVLEKTESLTWVLAEMAEQLLGLDIPTIRQKRDRAIARSIDRTLLSGEYGVLFIGAAHHVDDVIQRACPDISLIYHRTDWDALDLQYNVHPVAAIVFRRALKEFTDRV